MTEQTENQIKKAGDFMDAIRRHGRLNFLFNIPEQWHPLIKDLARDAYISGLNTREDAKKIQDRTIEPLKP